MRYYSTIPEVYEATRMALDTLWGHPKSAVHATTGTQVETVSCLPPVSEAVTDGAGYVYVALDARMADWAEVEQQIHELSGQGLLTEIDAAQYMAALSLRGGDL